VSYLHTCHHPVPFNGQISALPEKLISDPAFIELSDYSACEEAISLNDYGYASDSDLDEEEEEPDSRAQGGG